jgi:hypothetical protein
MPILELTEDEIKRILEKFNQEDSNQKIDSVITLKLIHHLPIRDDTPEKKYQDFE